MNEEEGLKKFNTCKHRSAEQAERLIHRCNCQGGNYTEYGFECLKRNIFKIDSNVCYYCEYFEEK